MQEKKYIDIIQDIEDTLISSSTYFINNIYVAVVGKKLPVRNHIEVLSEVDEDFLCSIYKKVLNKECEYNYTKQVYMVS